MLNYQWRIRLLSFLIYFEICSKYDNESQLKHSNWKLLEYLVVWFWNAFIFCDIMMISGEKASDNFISGN